MVECLPSKPDALTSNPIPPKNKHFLKIRILQMRKMPVDKKMIKFIDQ
jgi:hypothetical protein